MDPLRERRRDALVAYLLVNPLRDSHNNPVWGTDTNSLFDYFLIDIDPRGYLGLDILQFAPLFQPGNIEKHLEVRWRCGTAVLLTWPGPDTTINSKD